MNEQKKQTINHTRKLGNKQFASYLKSMPRISTITYNIQKYLSQYDPFYYNAFLSSIKGKDLDVLQKQLSQQYNRLVSGSSFLHKINNAVFSREKCLQKIKRDLTKVQAVLTMFKKSYFRKDKQDNNIYIEYTRQQGYTSVQIDQTIESSIKLISSLFVDLSRLRDMTIYIVETVHRWRVQIQEWMDKCQNHARIDFYLQVENSEGFQSIRLYDKLQDDTDFLWTSRLSQYIWLEYTRDPLIIRNVVNVFQKSQKELLEKYFIQFLYPKSQQVIDKTIKVVDMFSHVYKPKQINLYEEQEMLIQNYLSLERKNNQQIGLQQNQDYQDAQAIALLSNSKIRDKKSRIREVYSQQKITVKQQFRNEIQSDNKNWKILSSLESPYTSRSKEKSNPRGWVFGKQLRTPATDRIRQIVKKHQAQMNYMKNHKGIIKPFNISNYSQKKSLALAYLSQKNPITQNNQQMNTQIFKNIKKNKKEKNQFLSERQYQSNQEDNQLKVLTNKAKNLQNSRKRMYQSLVRINSIIEQDPKQHDNDQTPKNKLDNQEKIQNLQSKFFNNKIYKKNKQKTQQKQQKQDLSKTIDKNENSIFTKKNLINGAKINSIFNSKAQQNRKQPQQDQIQVDEQETPLNFKQFFQVFRADTNNKSQNQSRVTNKITKSNLKKYQPKEMKRSLPSRKLIDRKRSQSLKNISLLPYYSKNKKKTQRNNNKNLSKSKSITNSQNSFKSYKPVGQNRNEGDPDFKNDAKDQKIMNFIQDKQYISLKCKQITKDTIDKYIKHICGQIPISCQSFTNYHTLSYQHRMIQLLKDCTTNSLIFELEGQKDGKVGQAIVIESLSSTLKMRYSIQFINVQKFQLLSNCVCRISQELLSTSPCEEVVFKCVEDKADPVSVHFINLIDSSLKMKAQKFSYFHILQKSILGLTNQKLFERVYIFQSKSKNAIKEQIKNTYKQDWRKRVAGSNYRSLIFETKCLVLTSNFKMRSQKSTKPTIEIYKQESIGLLYAMLFQKIITAFHLKQLKVASLSVNDSDETTGLVKKSPFLRSIIHSLLEMIRNWVENKEEDQPPWLKTSITKFTNMTELLNYLSYKGYDQVFKFQFLIESRFILNHQLTLSQINLNVSLDFILESSVSLLLINNHHNYIIQQLSRPMASKSSLPEQMDTCAYILPSTDENLKIFIMSAVQYIGCSDNLDLYSYVELLFRESSIKQRHEIQQIAIPDLTRRKTKVNGVKMYDGFLRLFPQRQFYSASMFQVKNLWQNFYQNGVISIPSQNAIIIDYPIIIGFYDSILKIPIVSYFFKQEK